MRIMSGVNDRRAAPRQRISKNERLPEFTASDDARNLEFSLRNTGIDSSYNVH